MVHRKTGKYSPISIALVFLSIILIVLIIILGILIVKRINFEPEEENTITAISENRKVQYNSSNKIIVFQPIVNEWTSSRADNSSVLIYDLENDVLVGEHNPNKIYDTASLYKLFVVYEGYRKLENGELQPNSPAGKTGHTVLQCLDIAIRESDSECAEAILQHIGIESLNQVISTNYGIVSTDISNYTSTPYDILNIMKLFYNHPHIKNQNYLSQIKDSFLNQPETIYNWRQGLPSGFQIANVYDKVGWDYNYAGFWSVYHDAAIVEFPNQDRHYIVVVMTNNTPFEAIRDLGTTIEDTFTSTY